jgi:hypothetical protein
MAMPDLIVTDDQSDNIVVDYQSGSRATDDSRQSDRHVNNGFTLIDVFTLIVDEMSMLSVDALLARLSDIGRQLDSRRVLGMPVQLVLAAHYAARYMTKGR